MPKFRKKPVVIEAVQNVPQSQTPKWFSDAMARSLIRVLPDGSLAIATLEGRRIASPGDWIIRGVKDELYPCKPDIFAATYEEVPDGQ